MPAATKEEMAFKSPATMLLDKRRCWLHNEQSWPECGGGCGGAAVVKEEEEEEEEEEEDVAEEVPVAETPETPEVETPVAAEGSTTLSSGDIVQQAW